MIITNITKGSVGLDGIINFKPGVPCMVKETEQNIARAKRLLQAGLISIVFDEEALPPTAIVIETPAPEAPAIIEAPVVVEEKTVVEDKVVEQQPKKNSKRGKQN